MTPSTEVDDGNVVPWNGITRWDVAVHRVIEGAWEKDLREIVIVGYDHDGEFFFASSRANGPSVLWTLEEAKMRLMKILK
jgi:hypothetical protein